MTRRPVLLARLTAVVAGVQALVLFGYAVSIAVVALTVGVQGPEEVASPTGVFVETVVFALFGLGMGLVAVGRWRRAEWSTVPFVVAQLLALTVGIPLATASGWPRGAGMLTVAAALGSLAVLIAGRAEGRSEVGEADVDVREAAGPLPPRRQARH